MNFPGGGNQERTSSDAGLFRVSRQLVATRDDVVGGHVLISPAEAAFLMHRAHGLFQTSAIDDDRDGQLARPLRDGDNVDLVARDRGEDPPRESRRPAHPFAHHGDQAHVRVHLGGLQIAVSEFEREVFEAQLLLDEGKARPAAERAYASMLTAAKALTREVHPNLGDDADEVVTEFRARLHDTKVFHDPFVGPKFAQMFFRAHESRGADGETKETAHQKIEEAQLFVEAAYAAYQRMVQARQAPAAQ